jgi:hypothetical protein
MVNFLKKLNLKNLIALVVCLLSAVYFAVQSVTDNLQADYKIYEAIYNNLTLFDFQSCEGTELGWCMSAMFMQHCNMSYDLAAFVYALFIYGLAIIFLLRIATVYGVNYFALIGAMLIFGGAFLRPEMASHLTRQYIAAMLLAFAILEMALGTSRVWWLAFSAVMFHISALCMFPVFVYLRYFRFELKKFLGILLLLTGFLLVYKFPVFNSFVDWGLGVNIEPRILYNILYKIKYVAGGEDALPIWKFAFLGVGLIVGLVFGRSQNVKVFVYCYAYFLWLMSVTYFLSQVYFVRLFHHGKIMLFGLLMVMAAELFLKTAQPQIKEV